MKIYAGTSGYSYPEWKGSFYPEDTKAGDMLRSYARHLPAVEINNTFYRLPKRSVLQTWAEQVPESFRFAIKASRRITHFKRLKNTGEEMQFLLRNVATLGERLGTILFQLHPNLKKDRPRLESFLELLAEGTPAAFEFRHESWMDDEILDLLRGRGCAVVISDTDETEETRIHTAANWGYLRLRRSAYTDAELSGWIERLRAQAWECAFVFFKHEEEGPHLARRLLEHGSG